MAIADADKKILKDLAHLVLDEAEPQVIADLVAKVPVAYLPFAQMLVASLNPALIKAGDSKIDAL